MRTRSWLAGFALSIAACSDGSLAETEAGTESGGTTTETGDGDDDPAPFDYCDGLPPDKTCYALKRDPASPFVAQAMAIADRHMQTHPPTEQTWDWEASVFMFSLTELVRVTGEQRYLDHVRAWMDHHIESGYVIDTSDTCSPVAIAAALYAETGDPKYLGPFDDALIYLDEAVRSNAGGLSHFGTYPIAATLWADSLFMFGNVLTRWGELEDEQALFDELGLQFQVFTDVLQSDGGLYTHAWNWPTADPSLYWGRANGWISAAGWDYMRALLIRGQADPALADALTRQAEAVMATQDPSGLWWILLTNPDEIYLETSTTALLAYGLARGYRYGYIDGEAALPVIDSAVAAVRGKIVNDDEGFPIVTEVSGPTGPGPLEDYAAVPLVDDIGYGTGAVILALIERSGLPEGP